MKKSTRLIVIDNQRLRWRVSSQHRPVWRCELLVFAEARAKRALRICFGASECAASLFLACDGNVVFCAEAFIINLHLPKTVAILYRHAISKGWDQLSALRIADGYSFVMSLPRDVIVSINQTLS